MMLETSFILDLWDEKPEAVGKAREIDARGEPIYLPTPVLFELWEGVARSDRPRQEATKIQSFVSGHDICLSAKRTRGRRVCYPDVCPAADGGWGQSTSRSRAWPRLGGSSCSPRIDDSETYQPRFGSNRTYSAGAVVLRGPESAELRVRRKES